MIRGVHRPLRLLNTFSLLTPDESFVKVYKPFDKTGSVFCAYTLSSMSHYISGRVLKKVLISTTLSKNLGCCAESLIQLHCNILTGHTG